MHNVYRNPILAQQQKEVEEDNTRTAKITIVFYTVVLGLAAYQLASVVAGLFD